MGKDRQEKKLKKSRKVESDRDQSIAYPGATKMESSDEERKER
ncbi:YpzI family protein [Halobacillus campisalis]|uniref:YpzI family protein n=1 Tax=Halobacillus campisalis TaxID=435909 RepID=A0ABW2K0N8_9BACI|nr:YpzI family protein [Halobacillus campisalis]